MFNMGEEVLQKRFFIAKVNNFPSLRQAVQTSQWACADKATPPQPYDILTEAFSNGKVIIIFSVSNCHGWHGYAEMLTVPMKAQDADSTAEVLQKPEVNSDLIQPKKEVDTVSVPQDSTNIECQRQALKKSSITEIEATSKLAAVKSSLEKQSKFHYFNIIWKLNFLEFGEQCLHSKATENLTCVEKPSGNKISVNKCRNWQEVDSQVGESMCQKIHEFYDSLCKRRDEKAQKETECQEEPFYKETAVSSLQETWRMIVSQVEQELGKVILACPFGSQRYNLHNEDSDTDMFIVYLAKTRDILSFHPPKQTIKNRESESCDYTIHEVYRYCELLLSGDARCVETLFLHESTVVQASPEWHSLKEGRMMFLNTDCLDKYLRDAQGSKGTKYLQKWCNDNAKQDVLPAKMCKMLYVIVRLLQNARNIVNGEYLQVYRESGSEERDILMKIRARNVPVQDAWRIIRELEDSISAKSGQVIKRGKEVEEFLENWLMALRYENFHIPSLAEFPNKSIYQCSIKENIF